MFSDLFASYRSDLFLAFPVATALVSMGAFMLFAAPLTAIAALDPPSLRKFRIQRRRPRAQDLLWPSVGTWLANNVIVLVVVALAWPLLRLSGVHMGALPPWYVVLAQIIFFIYLDDFLYYWVHRAMHGQWLYKRVHGWHHRIVTPWAITGHYMHPAEYVVTAGLALVGPLVVGAHVVTVWLWFVLRQWEAAEGHCGYDFPWTPTHLLPLNDGAVHHDVHHERVRGNYAGFLAYVDGFFGTYARGYREELHERRGWAAPGIV